jgi:hypothetical protein
MGFKNSIDLLVPLPIQACFELLRQVGDGVKKYKLIDESPHTHSLTWRAPRKVDLNRVLARTLLGICLDDVDRAKLVLQLWFESSDPWPEARGLRFPDVFHAINRLIGWATSRRGVEAICRMSAAACARA